MFSLTEGKVHIDFWSWEVRQSEMDMYKWRPSLRRWQLILSLLKTWIWKKGHMICWVLRPGTMPTAEQKLPSTCSFTDRRQLIERPAPPPQRQRCPWPRQRKPLQIRALSACWFSLLPPVAITQFTDPLWCSHRRFSELLAGSINVCTVHLSEQDQQSHYEKLWLSSFCEAQSCFQCLLWAR